MLLWSITVGRARRRQTKRSGGLRMTHLVAIPLPVPSGLLVDLLEVLDVHADALEIRSDGQVLTVCAVAPAEQLAEPPAGLVELPPVSSTGRVEVPPGPQVSTNGSAPVAAAGPAAPERPSPPPPVPSTNGSRPPSVARYGRAVLDEVLAVAAVLSGFDEADLCGSSSARGVGAWRYAVIHVGEQRGAGAMALRERFGRIQYAVRARVKESPERYASMIDAIEARLDGGPEPSAEPPAPAPEAPERRVEPAPDPVEKFRSLVELESLPSVDPPPVVFPPAPPMARRPFDPDAARRGAADATVSTW